MDVKIFAMCLFIFATVFCSGCTKNNDRSGSKTKDNLEDHLERAEQISYYDMNGDGKVDREYHRYPGWSDADWELRDNDYNGRYEKKIRYGEGVIESVVDLPVPTKVHIEVKP
ncbi:MAG: hypothetical protein JWQ71_4832 [Pedosphaera sp.]|nr:hypothetical protein [Pedosphaera sp.]